MLDKLWIIPVLPLLGFLLLAFFGQRMTRPAIALIGAGSVGISALVTILTGIGFLSGLPGHNEVNQQLWTWINTSGLEVSFTLHLDALSLLFIFVITFVGFLIHLYSVAYMKGEEGYSRFFAYMNLFVASMLILVLADSLLFLYLGWEGVGLCSYLLIGFWYKDRQNIQAANKAFIVTRIGDTFLIIGLFLLFTSFHTLQIGDLLQRVPQNWMPGSMMASVGALLLLGGAVGKSAQLPLQTWLPDAMAGPTPVSALIHAATMVTAGVYLIARMHVLFALAPDVQLLVAIIGAATLLLAGFSALTQSDIKKVLAYSTISQIGYMFLALGVGAWSAAVFHFMIHAFFKALLFLGAGVVILSMHHEQNMFKMGGLRKGLPVTFWTYLIGAASLSAFPLITAGFYSKDLILWKAWSSAQGSPWLWAAGWVGAFLTALYSFRMVFLTFFGEVKQIPVIRPSYLLTVPLVILAFLSVAGGFIELPWAHVTFFSDLIHTVIPEPAKDNLRSSGLEMIFQILSAVMVLAGIGVTYFYFIKKPGTSNVFGLTPVGRFFYTLWSSGWGFDYLYDLLLVKPYLFLSAINRNDIVNKLYDGIAALNLYTNRMLSKTESGRTRWYIAGIVIGAIVSFTLMIWL
jgi:NADH-quinone oxidoreductase subunit L